MTLTRGQRAENLALAHLQSAGLNRALNFPLAPPATEL